MGEYIWISEKMFDWHYRISSSESYERNGQVSYEIWNHAKELIERNENKFYMKDSILNMKNSIDQRIKTINKMYSLDSIRKGKKGRLQTLEDLGILRLYLVRKIMEIRNNVEHNNVSSPDQERCRELLDITWWFLKSTDFLVQRQIFSIEGILPPTLDQSSKYIINLDINFGDEILIKTRSLLPGDYFFREDADGRIKVEVLEYADAEKEIYFEDIKNRKYISGKLILEENQLKTLLKRYFYIY